MNWAFIRLSAGLEPAALVKWILQSNEQTMRVRRSLAPRATDLRADAKFSKVQNRAVLLFSPDAEKEVEKADMLDDEWNDKTAAEDRRRRPPHPQGAGHRVGQRRGGTWLNTRRGPATILIEEDGLQAVLMRTVLTDIEGVAGSYHAFMGRLRRGGTWYRFLFINHAIG